MGEYDPNSKEESNGKTMEHEMEAGLDKSQ